MNNKIQKSLLAGVIGTAIMTVVMMIAPMMGMPKMSPPEMLAGMLGMPLFIGWVMHFMVGIMFAFVYTYLASNRLKIKNVWLKGAVFGFIVFVFAQIMMALMPMPKIEDSVMLLMLGSLIGHLIFGVAVAKTVDGAHSQTNLA